MYEPSFEVDEISDFNPELDSTRMSHDDFDENINATCRTFNPSDDNGDDFIETPRKVIKKTNIVITSDAIATPKEDVSGRKYVPKSFWGLPIQEYDEMPEDLDGHQTEPIKQRKWIK